ncbi:MAG TPA: hypothetical protein VFQ53_33290 [Kofleriaceae bacterium]|nr:hypothetical protein [Kofleriaceae bacterium]
MKAVIALALAGCSADDGVDIAVVPAAGTEPALRELVAWTPYPGLRVTDERPDGGLAIEVALDLACAQCYRIDEVPGGWVVHAGDLLGAQYGVAHALENLGFRFRTPSDTFVPDAPAFDPEAGASLGVLHEPAIAGQRGLQLHTLHPIEAHFALWQTGDDAERDARRIFDWIVKNRGNHVQWPALDDIMDPARHAEWVTATQALLGRAHDRGLTVGLGIQIFGRSNLQQAFDLADDKTGTVPFESELAARLPLVTTDLDFDAYVLSFGEFYSEDPARFIAAVDATTRAIHDAKPAASVHASIHVGADQRVTYNGEQLPYYFLVKYADPSIVSNVHTVMFYNLFEDAGGAYDHADFSEHRAYLFDQMRAGRPAAYYPESAYWIAFDNSVPLYLPLYVRSRWLDLDGIARQARDEGLRGLDSHLVFSSGWEWGYWLHDTATLRASYALPASPRALIAEAFGGDLAPAVDPVDALSELEARYLIGGRLAPYLAGRDVLIDAGDQLGIHSQPDRVTFDELARADAATRDAFARDVAAPLADFASALEQLRDRVHGLALADSRWSRELVDGFDVTAARARFVASTYEAVLASANADAAAVAAARDQLAAALAAGHAAVARRHADPHHAGPREQLFGRPANATVYGFGYLYQADMLCYWERERAQLAALLDGATEPAPACTL